MHLHCPNCGMSQDVSDQPGEVYLCTCDVAIQGPRGVRGVLAHTWGDSPVAHCSNCHHLFQDGETVRTATRVQPKVVVAPRTPVARPRKPAPGGVEI